MAKRDHTRLKELIMYIADRCQFRPNYGATMLNKILFFSDFKAYAKFGASITNEDYFKLPWGPAPKYLLEAQEELVKAGRAIVQSRLTTKGPQRRTIPLRDDLDLSVFSPEQISLIDSVIESLRDEDAESVSGLSHKFYGWQITKTEHVIPYATVFLKEPIPTPAPEAVRTTIDRLQKNRGQTV